MNLKPNSFQRNLKEGQRAEEIAGTKLRNFLTRAKLSYLTNEMTFQKKGIDALLSYDELPTIEFKTREFYTRKYNDLLFELKQGNNLGWYYTSKADWLSYAWWNPLKTDLYEGYLLLLQHPDFRRRLDQLLIEGSLDIKTAKSVSNGGISWFTHNAAMPIQMIPQHTIFRYIEPGSLGWGEHQKGLGAFA